MSLSLYQITVPSYLQLLHSLVKLVDKAQAHCQSNNLPDETLTEACLAEDMLPFAYQITSACHHSAGAIKGLVNGVFSPDRTPFPKDFAGLHARLAETIAYLDNVEDTAINDLVGKPMRFEMTNFRLDFTAENFALSFSLPNFYFHTTTAYDILRWQGLEIGKRDFLGKMRMV